jgi:hypothetical protein
MAIVDLVATPLAMRLLVCLADQVAQLEKPPANVMLRSGSQVNFLLSLTKNECCSGLAWVRVSSIVPSSGGNGQNFPSQDITPQRCGTMRYAVELEMGVVRCAPVATATAIPSDDRWNISAADTLADFAAMDRAICCFLDGFPGLALPGAWTPLAVQGMCVGGTMTITASADPCNCTDDESPASL